MIVRNVPMRKRPLCIVCLALICFIWLARLAGIPIFGEPAENSCITACVEEELSVTVEGTVALRDKKANSIQYILKESTLVLKNQQISLNTICVTTQEEELLNTGAVVRVTGTLSVPEQAGNPGQFDLRSYYESQGIYYTMWGDSFHVLKEGGGLKELLTECRNLLSERLLTMTDKNTAGVLSSMVLGDRTGLSDEMKRNYQVGGILHILAISGMHITLLGVGLYQGFRQIHFPNLPAALLASVSMALYCMMTGGSSSSVRALIMFLAYLGAKLCLRTYDTLCALSLAAILMLAEQPAILFSSGFQMSFTAVLGVVFVWPSVSWLIPRQLNKPGKSVSPAGITRKEQNMLRMIRAGKWFKYIFRFLLRQSAFWAVMNLSMLPLTVWYYYEIPLWGLIPNLILIPLVSWILPLGLAGIVIGMFSIRTGTWLLYPVRLVLEGIRVLTERIRYLPLSVWVCGKPHIVQLVLSVLALCAVTCLLNFLRKRQERMEKYLRCSSDGTGNGTRQSASSGTGLFKQNRKQEIRKCRRIAGTFLLIFLTVLLVRKKETWSVTMLDVGQGDCLILRAARNVFMVDGGSSSVSDVGTYRILPYLKSQGISELDGIFLTHPDADHMNGIEEILEAVAEKTVSLKVTVLYLPCWMMGTEDEEELTALAEKAGVVIRYTGCGDTFTVGSDTMTIEVLHPFYTGGIREGNSGSTVLSVSCGAFDALLTGDLESDGEEEILPLDHTYEYLKVGHHGSKTGSSEEFLEQVSPTICAVSAPADSRYGHPHQETIERLLKAGGDVYVTRDCGAITVRGAGDSFRLEGYLSSRQTDASGQASNT